MASPETKILLPYQRDWVQNDAALKIWLAARQIGKSFALAFEAAVMALTDKCNVLLLSASERQSREIMEKVYSHLRVLRAMTRDLLKAESETKTEVRLPNGSRIISLPANPDTSRGFSGHVFLDEFAFHRDSRAIWRALYPTVTRGYKIRITSTPQGKQNMFYELWAHNERFSKHKTDIYAAAHEGLPVDVVELRAGVGDPDAWEQEYECTFLDEATAYITYEMIAECEHEDAGKEAVEALGEKSETKERYLGMDIGRKKDLSVIWLNERVGDVEWTRAVQVLEKAPFRMQREALFACLPHVRRACIDATGLGMQLAEEAQERFGAHKVEAVTFTGAVKEDLAVSLRRRFEDRLIRVPLGREIREDLHAVRKIVTPAGHVRYDAERTAQGHADRFWAAALAVQAGSSPAGLIEFETTGRRREAVETDGFVPMRQNWKSHMGAYVSPR